MMDQNSCGEMLKQIHDEMEKNANNIMRADDITMAQCGALVILGKTPARQLSLKELERLLHVAQSTAAGIVTRLEQKGLVESFGSLEDRRVKMVRITPKGMERCLIAKKNLVKAETQLLSGLSESERRTFQSLLKKICNTL